MRTQTRITATADTQKILERKGYTDLTDYIQQTAEETGADTATAWELFYILGETELFDGYISSLEDYSYMIDN